MTAASLQRVLGRQDLLYRKLVQQCLRIVYGLRFSLVLVVAHDDPAAEFAVFGQFLAFVTDVVLGSIVFLRAVKRVADALDAGEHPKILVNRKTGQTDHVPSPVQVLRAPPVLVLLAGQDPFSINMSGSFLNSSAGLYLLYSVQQRIFVLRISSSVRWSRSLSIISSLVLQV